MLILADDLGYSDVGCFGGEIRTPNLDRLGREGVRFRQFFNTARCSPSRASLLTGLHPHQTGIGILTDEDPPGGYPGSLNDRCATLAEMLSLDGYATGMSGKWHMSSSLHEPTDSWPTRRGFDHFYGTIVGGGSYYQPGTLRRGEADASADLDDPGFYYTQAIADDATGFIRESAPRGPFFAYVAFTAPHWPLHAFEEDISAYDGVFDDGWDVLRERRLARQKQEGLLGADARLSARDPGVDAWEDIDDRSWWLRRMQVYAAQVERMDRGIGQIVDELERQGVLEETIIVFLSDNGACAEELPFNDRAGFAAKRPLVPAQTRDGRPLRVGNDHDIEPGPEDTYASYGRAWANLSNTPFRLYKRWVHEGGIACPMIVHWPAGDLADGSFVDAPFQLPDFVPTMLEATGAPYAGPSGRDLLALEGESMLDYLRGRRPSRDEATLCWEHIGNCALRRGDLKLVREYLGEWELYDLSDSRTEEHDLAAERPELVAELAAQWRAWADRVGVVDREQILRLYARRDGVPEESLITQRTTEAR